MIKVVQGPEYPGETYIWCSVCSPEFEGQNYHYSGSTEGVFEDEGLGTLLQFLSVHWGCGQEEGA